MLFYRGNCWNASKAVLFYSHMRRSSSCSSQWLKFITQWLAAETHIAYIYLTFYSKSPWLQTVENNPVDGPKPCHVCSAYFAILCVLGLGKFVTSLGFRQRRSDVIRRAGRLTRWKSGCLQSISPTLRAARRLYYLHSSASVKQNSSTVKQWSAVVTEQQFSGTN